eukprot:gene3645-4185_t
MGKKSNVSQDDSSDESDDFQSDLDEWNKQMVLAEGLKNMKRKKEVEEITSNNNIKKEKKKKEVPRDANGHKIEKSPRYLTVKEYHRILEWVSMTDIQRANKSIIKMFNEAGYDCKKRTRYSKDYTPTSIKDFNGEMKVKLGYKVYEKVEPGGKIPAVKLIKQELHVLEVTEALQKWHNEKGHVGVHATRYALKSAHFPSFQLIIEQHIRHCTVCQLNSRGVNLIKSITPINDIEPMCRLCYDLTHLESMAKLIEAQERRDMFARLDLDEDERHTFDPEIGREHEPYLYILVVIDAFTKQVWTCKYIYDLLTETFPKIDGKPQVAKWHSDNGREFRSRFLKEFLVTVGGVEAHGLPRTPTTQGVVERVNHTFKERLAKIVSECKVGQACRWVDHLYEATEIYNNNLHRSIGMSPYVACGKYLEATDIFNTTVPAPQPGEDGYKQARYEKSPNIHDALKYDIGEKVFVDCKLSTKGKRLGIIHEAINQERPLSKKQPAGTYFKIQWIGDGPTDKEVDGSISPRTYHSGRVSKFLTHTLLAKALIDIRSNRPDDLVVPPPIIAPLETSPLQTTSSATSPPQQSTDTNITQQLSSETMDRLLAEMSQTNTPAINTLEGNDNNDMAMAANDHIDSLMDIDDYDNTGTEMALESDHDQDSSSFESDSSNISDSEDEESLPPPPATCNVAAKPRAKVKKVAAKETSTKSKVKKVAAKETSTKSKVKKVAAKEPCAKSKVKKVAAKSTKPKPKESLIDIVPAVVSNIDQLAKRQQFKAMPAVGEKRLCKTDQQTGLSKLPQLPMTLKHLTLYDETNRIISCGVLPMTLVSLNLGPLQDISKVSLPSNLLSLEFSFHRHNDPKTIKLPLTLRHLSINSIHSSQVIPSDFLPPSIIELAIDWLEDYRELPIPPDTLPKGLVHLIAPLRLHSFGHHPCLTNLTVGPGFDKTAITKPLPSLRHLTINIQDLSKLSLVEKNLTIKLINNVLEVQGTTVDIKVIDQPLRSVKLRVVDRSPRYKVHLLVTNQRNNISFLSLDKLDSIFSIFGTSYFRLYPPIIHIYFNKQTIKGYPYMSLDQ